MRDDLLDYKVQVLTMEQAQTGDWPEARGQHVGGVVGATRGAKHINVSLSLTTLVKRSLSTGGQKLNLPRLKDDSHLALRWFQRQWSQCV